MLIDEGDTAMCIISVRRNNSIFIHFRWRQWWRKKNGLSSI